MSYNSNDYHNIWKLAFALIICGVGIIGTVIYLIGLIGKKQELSLK